MKKPLFDASYSVWYHYWEWELAHSSERILQDRYFCMFNEFGRAELEVKSLHDMLVDQKER